MNEVQHTSYPPIEKPILVYDGDCGFCKYSLVKWKRKVGDRINEAPFQTAQLKFKDIPESQFKKAVHLILTDGRVFQGAAAAFYSLHLAGNVRWYDLYTRSSIFSSATEWIYNLIARNRNTAFYWAKLILGEQP